ncbi:MAG: tetratricopeptide repeat protein, partial [Pyrinomonadaceae bacterium]|nr:tetratricopeptide repeat protein [Pyrinomonadaceae bacterium]
MSLTLITAYTLLRVLLGAASVGYSIYTNRVQDSTVKPEDIGTFNFGAIPGAIFGQAVGGVIYDFLKGGVSDSLEKYSQRINAIDSNSLNHDLQRAARKATLLATYFACQSCLADIEARQQNFWKKMVGAAWRNEDTKFLIAVSKNLKAEIANLENTTFDNKINPQDLFSIFDRENVANSKDKQEILADELKKETIQEIQNSFLAHHEQLRVYFSRNASRHLKDIYSTDNGFKLLKEAIKNVWEQYELPEEDDSIIQLKLTAYGKKVTRHDWFQLVCVIFNEEYKVNEKIEAAMNRQTTLEQTALLKQISANLQSFGQIKDFKNLTEEVLKFKEEIFEKLDVIEGKQDTAQESLDRIREKLDDVEITSKNLPKVVGFYVERKPFVDREVEQESLSEWLSKNGRKFVVIKAASGYGKTSLMTEVLYSFAPDYNLPSDSTGAIFIFYCRDNQGSFAEVCSKADARLGKTNKAGSYTLRYASFLQQTQQSPDALPLEIVSDLLEDLSALRHVWFIFENFESVLENNRIKDPRLNYFFEKALNVSGLHFLLTSQRVPQFETFDDIEEIHIGDLPEPFTLDFLQSEGAKLKKSGTDCGLAEITVEDLQTLKDLGFTFVPMALVALVGYFKSNHRRYGTTLTGVLQDQELFEQFREHDAKKGSMHLIERQYVALSGDERLVLKTLAIFGNAVEFPALAKVLAEHLDADAIDAVLSSSTLVRRIGANSYELLSQAAQIISQQPDKEDEKLNRQQLHHLAAIYFYSIRQPIAQCYTREQFAPYFNAADHSIKAQIYDAVVIILNEAMERLLALGYMREIIARCQLITGKLSQPELEANNFMNKGVALYSQGALTEAIAEYDKAIEIRERLVNDENRGELSNELAAAYMNKGVALVSQGALIEAIAEYDRAIAIRERLVNQENRGELANDLAAAYLNKGVALDSQDALTEAIAEYD